MNAQELQFGLAKADGFMDLSMHRHARQELCRLPWAARRQPEFRLLLLRLRSAESHWPKAAALARRMVRQWQDAPALRIQWAYAVRRSVGIEAARRILLEALQQFPKEPVISYNLACYDAQEGYTQQALAHYRHAIQLDQNVRTLAEDDRDLDPVRELIEAL